MKLKKSELNGLILMGGESSRMRSDKSLIKYRDIPQYQFLYELLSSYCDQVYLSCNAHQAKTIPDNFSKLVDNTEYKGPMSGIRNAFKYQSTNWLIVPIDMPFITDELVKVMVSSFDKNFSILCGISESNILNPLLGIYSKKCSNLLDIFKGDSPQKFVKSTDYQTIPLTDKQNSNINTQTDLDMVRKILRMS